MEKSISHASMKREGTSGLSQKRLRATEPYRHVVLLRLVAGAPLLGIGLMHVFAPGLGMRPLVAAAGLPFPSILASLAVAIEIVAGLSLLLGLWVRVGALLAVPTMLVAIYAHLVIDVWPNGPENEPPLVLPILVMAGAAHVLWRGAGRWSLDGHRTGQS